jgi:hypothetical protein
MTSKELLWRDGFVGLNKVSLLSVISALGEEEQHHTVLWAVENKTSRIVLRLITFSSDCV